MIIDIPTSEDFYQAGIDLLNLAWSSTIDLLSERITPHDGTDISFIYDDDDFGELLNQF